jgi:hypothetical protein
MAARKTRGLGKSLEEVFREIDQSKDLSTLIPTQRPQDGADAGIRLDPEFRLIPGADRVEREEQAGLEFDVQYVDDAKPPKDNYGQGPNASTRVASHKFVPRVGTSVGEGTATVGTLSRRGTPLGTVYVKFQPKISGARANDVYRYNNVPETVYEQFSQSRSKGRFINTHLNKYPYSRVGSREDRYHARDL